MQFLYDQQVALTRLWAGIAAILLIGMMGVSLATGVAQEPFEIVRDPAAYRSDVLASSPWLKVILAMDSLFIIAYASFFLCFARVASQHGDAGMLRLGVIAILATAILDIIEDQHLLALTDSLRLGEGVSLGVLRMQHVLSQTKFHLSYMATVFVAMGVPRRTPVERAFALAVGVPLPLIGIVRWVAPAAVQFPLVVAQWLAFLGGLLGAGVIVGWYSAIERADSR
ncbi:MAG: hypothetical protein ACKOHG_14870 [Planctomycetia bacterium]